MTYEYSPKYLRPTPPTEQAAADAQAIGLVQYNKSRIMDAELEAMVRRNPNRRLEAQTMKQDSGSDFGHRNDAPVLILSGILLIVTLTVILAALLV